MNQQDAQMMQNYPDPTAVAAESNGPFYSPNTNQQQQQRLSNPDDLQLAAQLSRGLEPMMEGGGGNEATHSPQSNPNHGFSHEQHMIAELNHGRGMDHSPYPLADGTTPRKRSKVSRACDECRRKKIRCDATTESGEEQCSSCKRVGTHCQFSRVPMKRGPSKGYIKELADRLNHLEGAIQNQTGDAMHYPHPEVEMPRRASNDYSPPPHMEGQPRKRTYSSISQDFGPGYQSQRQSGQWQQAENPRHLPQPPVPYGQVNVAPEPLYRPLYSPNGLAPQPQWRNAPPDASRGSFEGVAQVDGAYGEPKFEWDDYIADEYYKTIQPTFPLLPSSKSNFAARLANCPTILKDAVLEALNAAVRSISSSITDGTSARRAASLVSTCQFDGATTKSFSDNLVLLEALILMSIEAGSHGPSSTRSTGSQSVWLGAAVGLAFSLKLHIFHASDADDEDSNDNLARRIWWSLVILDRFHASGTSSPLMIPDTCAVLLIDDMKILGEQTYHLARLSSILGHISAILISPPSILAFPSPTAPLLNTLLTGELERFRESFPAALTTISAPLVHLTYWHVRLLMKRATPGTDPLELLEPAAQNLSILAATPLLASPLLQHFMTLASITLIELLDHESTRDESDRALKSLLDNPPRSAGVWEKSLRDLALKRIGAMSPVTVPAPVPSGAALTASQGLQHLADLATAGDAGRGEVGEGRVEGAAATGGSAQAISWDPASITRGGFLSVLLAETR